MGDESRVVLGTYKTYVAAQDAAAALRAEGFDSERIDILIANDAGNLGSGHTVGPKYLRPNRGAYIGAMVGAVLGMLGGVILVAISGIDPTFAAGKTLVTVLSAGFIGALGCGISLAFTGLGVPEHEEKRYEQMVRHGGVLLSVRTKSPEDLVQAEACLRRKGGVDVAASKNVSAEWTKLRDTTSLEGGSPRP